MKRHWPLLASLAVGVAIGACGMWFVRPPIADTLTEDQSPTIAAIVNYAGLQLAERTKLSPGGRVDASLLEEHAKDLKEYISGPETAGFTTRVTTKEPLIPGTTRISVFSDNGLFGGGYEFEFTESGSLRAIRMLPGR